MFRKRAKAPVLEEKVVSSEEIENKDLSCENLDLSEKASVSETMPVKKHDYWNIDKISYYILLATVFLVPIFFLPLSWAPYLTVKTLIITVPVLLALIFWSIASLKKGSIEYSKNLIFPSAGLVVLTYLLSSLFSDNLRGSFFGSGYETGTFYFVSILFVLMLLISITIKDRMKVLWIQLAILASSALMAIFHAVRFISIMISKNVAVMNLGFFGDSVTNTVGSWLNFGIFFGLIALLSLIALENLPLIKKWIKYIIIGMLAVSLLFVSMVNYPVIWYIIGGFSIISLIYTVSIGLSKFSKHGSFKIPYTSLIVLVLSLIFVLGVDAQGNSRIYGDSLSKKIGISQIEVRPLWSTSYDLTKEVLKKDPVFGVGPNRFTNVWMMNKPGGVNATQYWNTNFDYLTGYIPTSFATTGTLGFLAWIIFIALFIYFGFKIILGNFVDKISRYLAMSTFFGSVYLWIFAIIYVPSPVLLFMTFMMTGLFLAVAINEGMISRDKFVFLDNAKKSFISVLILVIVLIGSLATGYTYIQKYMASVNYQNAVTAQKVNNLTLAENDFLKAISLDQGNGLYYRSLAYLYQTQITNLLNQKDLKPEQAKPVFQKLLASAVNNVKLAIQTDPNNYENYMTMGSIYESLVPIKVDGAFAGASDFYNKAITLNPSNPQIYLSLARLEALNKNYKGSIDNINKALTLKRNYTDAFTLAGQVEMIQGDTQNALAAFDNALASAPDDAMLLYQVGVMKFNLKNYEGAVVALERSVMIEPYYGESRRALGLAYQKVGRTAEAVTQFEILAKFNPNNQDITNILDDLRSGKTSSVSSDPTPAKIATTTAKTTKKK